MIWINQNESDFVDSQTTRDELRLASKSAVKSGFDDAEVPVLLSVLTERIKKARVEEELFAIYKKRKTGG